MRPVSRVVAAALALGIALAPASAAAARPAADDKPLAGKVILLDPGHQLGNSNPRFARQMSQTFFNGSIRKGCNTTGTATNGGFPEATFTWKVANRLKPLLEAQGATVRMTRSSNSYDAWGPCVLDRAKMANRIGADAMISIHADGASSGSKGFFAMAPSLIPGWTDDVVKKDRRLATSMIAGMAAAGAPRSNYIPNQLMISRDTTSLNVSNVPTVTIEVGNMRNAQEARRMSSSSGQRDYARWLAAGIERQQVRELVVRRQRRLPGCGPVEDREQVVRARRPLQPTGGRFHVRVRQPGVQREKRHLDGERQRERREQPGLHRQRHARLQHRVQVVGGHAGVLAVQPGQGVRQLRQQKLYVCLVIPVGTRPPCREDSGRPTQRINGNTRIIR